MSSSSNETNFNNLKEATPNTKKIIVAILGMIGTIAAAVVVWLLLVKLVRKYVNVFTAAEIIAVISLFLAISKCAYDICKRILHRVNASKKKISLRVDSELGFTTVTCKISNQDTRRIKPKDIYLFIEKGLQPKDNNIEVRFPFLLCHATKDAHDCKLGEICKLGNLTEFPDHIVPAEFKNLECGKRYVIRLDELCQEGRHYIDPGEEFAQDVVLKFPDDGVYRATVIWTSEKNDDCICASKVFVVIHDK